MKVEHIEFREMENLIKKYLDLGIDKVIDHDRFNSISIVHHSTALEGSTLTEVETGVLINEGLTPKGKPLYHSLMVEDHYRALGFVIEAADKNRPVSIELIKEIAGRVLKRTGGVYQTVFGEIDASKGEFRKGNVTAGRTYFPNYDKVESLMDELVHTVLSKMNTDLTVQQKLNLSFDAHFNLVSIHPFYDGNGRTSRLLMNYIQRFYKLPLSFVHSESKSEYIQALIDTREKDDIRVFRDFMQSEYARQLEREIEKYNSTIEPKKGRGFHFMF